MYIELGEIRATWDRETWRFVCDDELLQTALDSLKDIQEARGSDPFPELDGARRIADFIGVPLIDPIPKPPTISPPGTVY